MNDKGTATTRRTVTLIAAIAALVGIIAVVLVAVTSETIEPKEAWPAPRYVDDTEQSGLVHSYDGDWTFFVGGGIATFDCDDDGKLDVFIAGGEQPSRLFRNTSEIDGPITFDEVSEYATSIDRVTGAYPIDIDSDGRDDLIVLRNGPNMALRGDGNCQFEQVDDLWNIPAGDAWTTAFSATWEGSNNLPTLAFGNYVLLDEDGFQNGDCYDNALLRPDGDRYGDTIPLHPSWCTLSMMFSDWNRSGNRDLRVSNDRHYYRDGEEQLWHIEPETAPWLYEESEGWNSLQIWGMGIASHDVAGDDRPEVLLTSQGDNKLQILTDQAVGPDYRDIAIRRGVTAHRPYDGGDVRPSTAWHPEFQDVNNDGFVDLYISKGNVDADPAFASDDPNNLLLGQPDGTFLEGAIDAGIVHYARTRGAAVVDLNGDGWLDIIEVNRVENVRIWRNTGSSRAGNTAGHWVAIELVKEAPNSRAVGAWVSVRIGDHTMERELTIGGGHASGQLGPLHFGLGRATRAEVMIQWPDGSRSDWLSVDADQVVTVSDVDGGKVVGS